MNLVIPSSSLVGSLSVTLPTNEMIDHVSKNLGYLIPGQTVKLLVVDPINSKSYCLTNNETVWMKEPYNYSSWVEIDMVNLALQGRSQDLKIMEMLVTKRELV